MKSKRIGNTTAIRHRNAETVKGEGHPAFAFKEEVIIVRLSADDKERLRLAARPLSLSAFIRQRLGIG